MGLRGSWTSRVPEVQQEAGAGGRDAQGTHTCSPQLPDPLHPQSGSSSLAVSSLVKAIPQRDILLPLDLSFTETHTFSFGVNRFILQYVSGSMSAAHIGRSTDSGRRDCVDAICSQHPISSILI